MDYVKRKIPFFGGMWYNPDMEKLDFLRFYTDTPKFTHEPGLSVMKTLMDRLGNPQDALRCVHIAGTDGKGSTAAMTASVLRAAGWKTGLYTSPDLTGIWERIQIDGVYITQNKLEAVTRRVMAACEGLPEPSYFEKLTAAAFLHFAEAGCGAVVLETGLGGRLDATNIIKKPLASVVTPIGYDHTGVLGGSLSAIAAEKAGIIKNGCPVVSAPQEPEAAAVIRSAAAERRSPLHEVNINNIQIQSRSVLGQVFSYGSMGNIFLRLLGGHQTVNAACAIEAAELLGMGEDAIRKGLESAVWPCRFEYFDGTPPMILDGAHNPHGAAALAAGLRDYFPGRKFTFLLGVMADKDVSGILAMTEPLAERFICYAPDYDRALTADDLRGMIRSVPAVTAVSLEEALTLAKGYNETICAFGSLYYIGELRGLITKEN